MTLGTHHQNTAWTQAVLCCNQEKLLLLSEEQHQLPESRLCFNLLGGSFGAGSEQGEGEVVLGPVGLEGHLGLCATRSGSVQQTHPQKPLPIPKHFQTYS